MVATNQLPHEPDVLVINPRNTAFFIHVIKEQLTKVWISKLTRQIEKYTQLVTDFKAELAAEKKNRKDPGMTKNYEDGIRQYNVLLDFLSRRKKVYINKLASLSTIEKKEPAEAGAPRELATAKKKCNS